MKYSMVLATASMPPAWWVWEAGQLCACWPAWWAIQDKVSVCICVYMGVCMGVCMGVFSTSTVPA